jgi:hypothetical protein
MNYFVFQMYMNVLLLRVLMVPFVENYSVTMNVPVHQVTQERIVV